jgi:carboxyl-terminal processing protease
MHEEDSARSLNRRPSRFRPTQRVLLLIATGVFLLQAGFIAGLLLERNLARGGPWGDQDLSIVSTLLEVVQEDYYYQPGPATPEAAFEQSLQHGAATGMLETLDGYSQFLPPREARQAAAELSGQYEGIGVVADFVDGALTVTSPMIGSPAEAAGIQPGDVIVAADGRALAEVSEDEALSLLRGEAGTTVVVTIQRAGERAPLEIEVARQAITVPVVTYQLIPGTRVGHIRVTIFGDTTTGQLDAALQRAAADGAAGIILDLRSNGGGWVRSAQESIGRFVPEERGPALYEDNTPGPGGEQPHPIVNSDVAAYDVPLAVLVDGGTASAAEIVAGALQDYERATIVGQTTFGKGSVQRVYEFEDGSSARITFAEWLTPAKLRLQGAGVVPDVVVDPAMAPSQTADPWVRAALTLLGASDRPIERSTPSATPVSVHG